ncbi:hypothetical protein [Micromonospora globbae]|uniref:ESX-1 secretion-associated protein n=1 Tax=Micromonospora globbae TaxID=1894969 RepID=A0A420F431_9ACTN|nr:hypothetical protein [Micromonospora globbae]RKF27689.1 hypothetical protein D7I43_08295 [Micromonospora globbae]WTF86817.1 hypothetical protein OH732_04230 [Micromonospora globbae]
MTGRTEVDLLSLEDFHKRLADRLTQADSLLRKLNTEMQCRPPALGTFAHATSNSQRYSEIHQSYVEQVGRLQRAVKAAQEATSTILTNYRTAEARNAATADDIRAALDGVNEALNPEEKPRV